MNVVFDAMGTLFDLAPVRERLGAAATEAWFERHTRGARARRACVRPDERRA